ncbi:trimethylamine methyltransferase family protein [Paracoccaceae bacterium]|nr:trimethylamine methyltransferase family protein [Paracoccaceae bacterium]
MTADRLTRGRRGRRQESANPVPTIVKRPFEQLKRPYQPVPIISDDQVEHIHQASLKLLSETGLDVLHDDARALMKKAGACGRWNTVPTLMLLNPAWMPSLTGIKILLVKRQH